MRQESTAIREARWQGTAFNRHFLSDLLALLAALLIILAVMELLPHPVAAIADGVLVVLIVVDVLMERRRENDLGQATNRRLRAWLKGHLLRFSYLMSAHIALLYFLAHQPETWVCLDIAVAVIVLAIVALAVNHRSEAAGPASAGSNTIVTSTIALARTDPSFGLMSAISIRPRPAVVALK